MVTALITAGMAIAAFTYGCYMWRMLKAIDSYEQIRDKYHV